jgi:hypothetical protein
MVTWWSVPISWVLDTNAAVAYLGHWAKPEGLCQQIVNNLQKDLNHLLSKILGLY